MNSHWKKLTLVPCLMSSLLAAPALAASPSKADLAKGAEKMAHLLAKKAPGLDTLTLDLSDKQQYDFVLQRLRASGNTPENSPRLFARLQQARGQAAREGTNAATCNHSIELRQEPLAGTTLFGAKALVGCVNADRDYVFADMSAWKGSASGLEQLGQKAAEDYTGGGRFDAAAVDVAFSPNKGERLHMDSLMLSFDDKSGAAFASYSMLFLDSVDSAQGGDFSTQATLDYITIEHPKEITGGAPIRLCLNRGLVSGNIDCDYGSIATDYRLWPRPNETLPPFGMAADVGGDSVWSADGRFIYTPATPWDYTKTYMPLQGVLYAGSEDATGNCTINGINSAKAELFYLGGDAACGYAVNALVGTANFPNYFALGGNSSTYKLLANFGTICTGYEKQLKLRVTINYQRKCGTSITNRIKVLTYAYPVDFRNSCFAEGTEILMADGSTKAIEQVKVGEKVVADAQGTVLTVTGFGQGAELDSMIQLKTDKGHTVEVTAKHPVLTPKGTVAADSLRAKDQLLTREGVATLTSAARVPVKSMVYNLQLGTPEELAQGAQGNTTLFANGLLMGDHRMQIELEDRNATSVAARSSVSKAWRKDHQNDLARGALLQ